MAEELREDAGIEGGEAPTVTPTQTEPALAPRPARPDSVTIMLNAYANRAVQLDGFVKTASPDLDPTQRVAVETPMLQIVAREAALHNGVDFGANSIDEMRGRWETNRDRQVRARRPAGFGTKWEENPPAKTR